MIIGIPREIKTEENRVAMTPAGVDLLTRNGHRVLVERNAGTASGFNDQTYNDAGAETITDPSDIYARADMIMHVKEPLPGEYELIREGQIIFTFLHLAASGELTEILLEKRSVNIAYETVQLADGTLPLLKPMSEIAGRMAILQGAHFLEMRQGGRGVLLSGSPGVHSGTIVILGGGTVGANAARIAGALGARVYILDKNIERLRYLEDILPPNCFTLMSTPRAIGELLPAADVVVGSVLIPGAKAPKLITRAMIGTMKNGSVIVDVAIDQGGCCETSRPTSHADPVFVEEGVIHYCVANMPGTFPETSTRALTNATLPYVLEIAQKGWQKAMLDNLAIRHGINTVNGKLTCRGVADAFGMPYTPVKSLL